MIYKFIHDLYYVWRKKLADIDREKSARDPGIPKKEP